jgi:hypothetical protein
MPDWNKRSPIVECLDTLGTIEGFFSQCKRLAKTAWLNLGAVQSSLSSTVDGASNVSSERVLSLEVQVEELTPPMSNECAGKIAFKCSNS